MWKSLLYDSVVVFSGICVHFSLGHSRTRIFSNNSTYYSPTSVKLSLYVELVVTDRTVSSFPGLHFSFQIRGLDSCGHFHKYLENAWVYFKYSFTARQASSGSTKRPQSGGPQFYILGGRLRRLCMAPTMSKNFFGHTDSANR